jgi:FkbM family methyltransferase
LGLKINILRRFLNQGIISNFILRNLNPRIVRSYYGQSFLAPIESFILDGYNTRLYEGLLLDENSEVVVVGGYVGVSAQEIFQKFSPNLKIIEPVPEYVVELNKIFSGNKSVAVIPLACSNVNGYMTLSVDGERSGSFYGGKNSITVQSKPLSQIIGDGEIDFIEVNIEGAEYDVIPELVDSGKISNVRVINIQFHQLDSESDYKRAVVRRLLRRTHIQNWSYDWVWEQWVRRDG